MPLSEYRYAFFDAITSNKKKKLENMSLHELENEIYDILKKQNQIMNCNLSAPIEKVALMELEEQKKQFKEMMHKKVDEL